MKKEIIVIAIFTTSLLFGSVETQAQVVIRIKPPAPKVVVVKPKPPKSNYVWISGYWKWNKRYNKYNWVEGYWAKPKKGKIWVPSHYKKVRGGYKYLRGHWKRV